LTHICLQLLIGRRLHLQILAMQRTIHAHSGTRRSPNSLHLVDPQSSNNSSRAHSHTPTVHPYSRSQSRSQHIMPSSSSFSSSSSKYSSKYYHPYFTPAEIEYLSEKQRGKQTVTQEDKIRQSACTFLETMGVRVGL